MVCRLVTSLREGPLPVGALPSRCAARASSRAPAPCARDKKNPEEKLLRVAAQAGPSTRRALGARALRGRRAAQEHREHAAIALHRRAMRPAGAAELESSMCVYDGRGSAWVAAHWNIYCCGLIRAERCADPPRQGAGRAGAGESALLQLASMRLECIPGGRVGPSRKKGLGHSHSHEEKVERR